MEQAQGHLDALQILADSSSDMNDLPDQFETRAQATGMNYEMGCG